MNRRIDVKQAQDRLGELIDRAVSNNDRFIVDRSGEPTVVIMSVRDYIRTAVATPDWLTTAWSGAERDGLDALTPDDIDAEIAAYRARAKRPADNGAM